MFKKLLGALWRRVPGPLRRLTIRATNARFNVTVAAAVFNDNREVLLLKHRFRPGSGWGLPGGFLKADEQPEDALRRELREEIRLEIKELEIFGTRSFKKPQQIEIVFICRTNDEPSPQSMEIEIAQWFKVESLPSALPRDQRRLIQTIVVDGAKWRD